MPSKFISLVNVKEKIKKNPIDCLFIYPIGKKHFILNEDLRIMLSNGELITIEKGLLFDGSSSPRFLWSLFPSYGNFFLAAIIHDWMYINDYRRKELGLKKARKFADKEMLIWSKELNDQSILKKVDNVFRYYAVRLFGKNVYIR